MKPLVRLCVSVWTALLLAQHSHAVCVARDCRTDEIEALTATTTTINLASRPNCTLSIDLNTSGEGSLAGLTPGTVYQVLVTCLNCCKEITTWPDSVRWNDVVTLNTTNIHLDWMKPQGDENEYTYRVQTTGCGSQNKTVNETHTQISGLTPGTLCTFCVFVIAADGTEGEGNCTSQYTEPGTVQPSISSQGSNSSVLVSWTRPAGNVESFTVYLNSTSSALREHVLNSANSSIQFENLSAGTLYSASVITHSGQFNASSGFVTNATFPNPPGSIEVLTKTTSSIEIRWMEAPLMTGASFFYKLSITPPPGGGYITTTNTSHTFDSLLSGTSYNISIVTVGAMNFESEKVHIYMVTTRPYSVRWNEVVTLNTTSVRLDWIKPQDDENEYKYRVQTTGCGSQNKTVNETHTQISGLTPGTLCTFCVFVIAADGTEGEANCTSQYTEPGTVQPSISSQGSNSSVLVSWTRPAGNVESFTVYLNSTSSVLREHELNSANSSIQFENLTAGTLYSASVITHSGQFNASSGFVTNATFPNPPGSIEVLTKTNSSIEIRWMEAHLMTGASLFYKLSITPPPGGGFINTTNTSHTFDSLLSGTSYNISIVTVGAMNFESEKVHIYMVTTRPYSVRWNDVVTLNTTSVHLDWMKPQGDENEYTYRVQTTGCGSQNKTVNETHTQISGLTPGTLCTFCVFVIAANGTEGEANCTSQYTKPGTVQPSISSQGSNSSVLVSWTRPAGNVESFTVYLNSTSSALREHVLNSANSSIQFENLSAGTRYSARVITHSGQFNASSGFVTNATFPNPPGSIEVLTKTTSTIEIRWMEAPLMTGASFFYKLSITPPPGGVYITTTNTSHTFDSLLSGTSYNISIVTVGAVDFESEKVHIYMVTTRPCSVRWNEVVTLNTTSIHLDWMKPQDDENEYTYRVQTTGCGSQNKTVNETHTQISGLTPGTLCTFCVFVMAADGTEGEANCTSQYTKPGTVQPSISSQGSNSSVLVSWTRPAGNVEYFTVYLNSTFSALREHELNSANTSIQFENLSAGTLYSASVITHSGQFNASSGFVTNATFPNPPGSIEVLTKTTSSIEIRWMEAHLMTGASFFYKLSITPPPGGGYINTTNTSHTFDTLLSGTSYNISIVTVGAKNLESEEVHIYTVTTRPYSVRWNDAVTLNTTSVHLDWMKPQGDENEYTYRVQTTGCGSQNKTVNETHTQISGLTPGTLCTFCVFVIAADGTEGEANCISQYTKPGGVQPSISSQGSNSSVLVSWTRPAGNVESFTVYLKSTFSALREHKLNSANSSIQFENLTAGTRYSASVITHSGQFNASSGFVTNATFPNPPGSIEVLTKTTSTIEIRWTAAPLMTGASFFYKLSITPLPGGGYINTTNTSHTFDSLLSGTSYNVSIVTVGAMDFESEKVHIYMVSTRPCSVRWNEVVTLNTTSVRLDWMKPQDDENEYKYRVQTTGCGSQNKTVNETHTQISGLTPGTLCTFCIFVIAADGTEGEANCTSQYTKPGSVQPSISNQGSNSSVLVSWTRPAGNVEYFTVYLNSTSSALREHKLNSANGSIQFENLTAGTRYSARVITHSGQFNASSGFVTNATFPNPPGSIEVLTKTNSSIAIRWEEAPLMTGASFFYKLSITPPPGGGYITTTNTSHTFDSLLFGTSYNISIVTVGAMDFESEKVHIYMVTARQLFVESVVALIAQEDNITITWPKVTDYTGSFHYNVSWQSIDGLKSITTTETKYTIFDLNPGSRCTYSVTPETPYGGPGATTSNSTCTNASPVKNLRCESPNKTNAEIILSWTKPRGEHVNFLVAVNESNITNKTNTNTYNLTLLNLRHFTQYTLTVLTLSCGQPSTPVSLDCLTGIADPPIPPNFLNQIDVVAKDHHKFVIQINRELLDSSNGPVTHIGVLVTNSLSDDTSNLKMYLGKTYKQWRAKDTPVYLATVRETKPQSRSGDNHLSIEIGDDTRWEGYTNGVLDANGRYQFAVVLFTSLHLHDGLVKNTSLVSVTEFHVYVLLPQNPAVIGIAVGVTLGIFCVLLIILVGFIVYWRRVSNKESSDIQINSLRTKVSVPVRVEDYDVYFRKQRADSNCGFAEEFEDLKPVGTGQSKTSAQIFENKPKNRYNNVLPYDSSRVRLSIVHGSPYDDYINANYMPGFNSRKEYIAAQGPLPATVNEFWRMIWEKNVQTLVMLTRCHEQGRVKCEQYWDSGTKHFENITVTTTSDIPLEDWTIRDFDIKNVKTAETRSVRQFHFTAWPDHGVPETTELLIGFRHLVREHMDQYSKYSPTVVHCSAGVGRTGTFIAIDTLIFQIERENNVDVYGIVHDLRMHRPLMVQTEDQYVFLNQCALDIIRSRTGTNVDLIYQNTGAFSIYENIEPIKGFHKNRYRNA